jgi:integrase
MLAPTLHTFSHTRMSRPASWVTTLRAALRHEHGLGWLVAESRGRVRLTRRTLDGVRETATLPLPWRSDCITSVIATVGTLRQRMEERGIGLAAAAALQAMAPADGPVDWPALVTDYLAVRADLRPTTRRDLSGRLQRLLVTLASRPTPRDGPGLLRAYARQHFDRCPPGGQGRKRQLGDVAAFLRWAVERRGVPVCWAPPPADHLAELVGQAPEHTGPTVPIGPEQLAGLLDHLEAIRPELWLAVALVGCYGLRPAELGVLRVRAGRLYVGAVKRNRRTATAPKPDRLVLPLELEGRDDGGRALRLFESGLVELPAAVRTAAGSGHHKRVGDAFRQLLNRLPYWRHLGLTPYALRHGFAWRGAHRQPPIPLRDLAAVMGHSPQTHLAHYGVWTAEADLIASFLTVPDVSCTVTELRALRGQGADGTR